MKALQAAEANRGVEELKQSLRYPTLMGFWGYYSNQGARCPFSGFLYEGADGRIAGEINYQPTQGYNFSIIEGQVRFGSRTTLEFTKRYTDDPLPPVFYSLSKGKKKGSDGEVVGTYSGRWVGCWDEAQAEKGEDMLRPLSVGRAIDGFVSGKAEITISPFFKACRV